jgi:pimeloyl-ACP methyl ester carboxylesterase
MAPVARELSRNLGVLEPLLDGTSITRQIEEVTTAIKVEGEIPVTIVGHSWGAMLSCLVASDAPHQVRKVVLVASGPFEQTYVDRVEQTRLARLSPSDRLRAKELRDRLDLAASTGSDSRSLLEELGRIYSSADTFDPLPLEADPVQVRADVYQAVWPEVEVWRRSGRLLESVRRVRCPVVAIHGSYDPHPEAGVSEPLGRNARDFRLVRLDHCGHTPWLERGARDRFFAVLRRELGLTEGSNLPAPAYARSSRDDALESGQATGRHA